MDICKYSNWNISIEHDVSGLVYAVSFENMNFNQIVRIYVFYLSMIYVRGMILCIMEVYKIRDLQPLI